MCFYLSDIQMAQWSDTNLVLYIFRLNSPVSLHFSNSLNRTTYGIPFEKEIIQLNDSFRLFEYHFSDPFCICKLLPENYFFLADSPKEKDQLPRLNVKRTTAAHYTQKWVLKYLVIKSSFNALFGLEHYKLSVKVLYCEGVQYWVLPCRSH